MISLLNFDRLASPSRGTGWLATGSGKWTCLVCKDNVAHSGSHLKRHVSTTAHKRAMEYSAYAYQTITEAPDNDGPQTIPLQAPRTPSPFNDDTEALSTMIEVSVGVQSRPISVLSG